MKNILMCQKDKQNHSALVKILLFPLRAYQYFISPLLGDNCRFYPSCSEYAKEAIIKLPLHIAFFKIVWRLLRCHPFSKGGEDPVIKD